MRVFLTGATGFIGGHALRALVARGHEVTCLVRGGSGNWPRRWAQGLAPLRIGARASMTCF